VTVYEFDGSLLHWRAATGVSEDPAVREASKAAYPTPPTRHLLPGRAILDRAIVHVRDHDADTELHRISLTVKSSVVVPLMRGNLPIGALHMGSRERGGFSAAQVGLLKTFAEQAVIAITSAETYRELQERTRDLQESLQQQTATTDKLATINASTGNLGSVFDMILTKAHALCGVNFGSLQLYDGERIWAVAVHGLAEEFAQILRQGFPATESPWFQAALEGHRHFHILDAAKSDSAVMRTAAEGSAKAATLTATTWSLNIAGRRAEMTGCRYFRRFGPAQSDRDCCHQHACCDCG
jgi:two-component system, NtrC family, sensor kinase